MNKINKFYTLILSLVLFLGAGFVLSGCKDNDDKCNLIIFSSVGGYVQVDDSTDYVFNGDEGTTFKYKEDDIVTLKAIAKEGYVFQKWTYGTDESDDYNDNYSTVAEIKVALSEDTTVLHAVFILNTVKFSVSWEDGTGYSIVPTTTLDADNKLAVGNSFSFTITQQDGYDYTNMVVKSNGKVLTADNGVYTTDKIYSNVTISVTGIVTTGEHSVILSNDVIGCELDYDAQTSVVKHGEDFSFRLDIDEAYSNSMVEVFANGIRLNPEGRVFTVKNITEDVVITVTGLRKNRYTVTIPTSSEFTIQSAEGYNNVVEYGGSYKFKLIANNAGIDLSNVIVEYDGLAVGKDAQDGTYYLITNITSSETIIVRNLEVNTFVVNIPVSDKYTITPAIGYSTIIDYNADFKFTLTLAEGYEADNIVIKYNSQTAVKEGNYYVISNITSSNTISVTGVNKIKFTFNDITTEDYKIEFNNNVVEYGDNVEFEVVSVNEKVDLSNIVVKNGNTQLIKGSGYYTVENIKTNELNIIVEGIMDIYSFEIDFAYLFSRGFEYDVTYPNEFSISLYRDESTYNEKIVASSIIVKAEDGSQMNLAEFLTALNNNVRDFFIKDVGSLNIGNNQFITINDISNDGNDFEVIIDLDNLNNETVNVVTIELL